MTTGGQSVLQSQKLSFYQIFNMLDSGSDSEDCGEDLVDEDGEAPNPFEDSQGTTEVPLTQRSGVVQRRLCLTSIGGKCV